MRIFSKILLLTFLSIGLLSGCSKERLPRSVTEFVENPIMLEAAMVRCSEDRNKTRYDAECVNARQAVSQIEAKEDALHKADFDQRSEAKRQVLRRTQEAAAQARRRAAENERLRVEAEYLAQFGVAPPTVDRSAVEDVDIGNSAGAVIPKIEDVQNRRNEDDNNN